MNLKVAPIFVGIFVLIGSGRPTQSGQSEERPILEEPPAKLVEVIESMGKENAAAARVNVANDAVRKRLRIYSTAPAGKTGVLTDHGYEIEVIYDADIASLKSGVLCYRFQHNTQVLAFAAAQITSGSKAFGQRLIELLVDAEPDLFWEDRVHSVVGIREIFAKIRSGDGTVSTFLNDESALWTEVMSVYGTTNQEGAYLQIDNHLRKLYDAPHEYR